MSDYTYRITYEHVRITDADRILSPHTPNSQIPARHWSPTPAVIQTRDPWGKYWRLKELADNDTGMVRNVKLERTVMPPGPTWEVITP